MRILSVWQAKLPSLPVAPMYWVGRWQVAWAQRGAKVGILGRRKQEADRAASEIAQTGGEALPLLADVLDRTSLEDARDALFARWDRLDILVNAAGGNVPAATVDEDATFFELPEEPLREVFDLNLLEFHESLSSS